MQSRKPLKASLPHTVTLWNQIEDKVVNGAPKKVYQRTALKNVRYEVISAEASQMAGSFRKDELKLFVFNGAASAVNNSGDKAKYLEPIEFDSLQNKAGHWTLRADDYIALGLADGSPEECGGRVYTIVSILPCYGMGPNIHHWEVVAK